MSELNLKIASSSDGKSIKVQIPAKGNPITLAIPVERVGILAAGLLSAAMDCAKKTGVPKDQLSKIKDPSQLGFAQASAAAISDGDTEDVAVLTFGFGAASLSICLPRETLAPLGSALWADSAKKTNRSQ